MSIRFRKPSWCKTARLDGVSYEEKDGYFVVEKVWKNEELFFDFPMEIEQVRLNGKTALTYGALVLALDESKGNKGIDEEIRLKERTGKIEKSNGELLRYRVERENGDDLLFTDYASSGKNWENSEKKMSVWLDIR